MRSMKRASQSSSKSKGVAAVTIMDAFDDDDELIAEPCAALRKLRVGQGKHIMRLCRKAVVDEDDDDDSGFVADEWGRWVRDIDLLEDDERYREEQAYTRAEEAKTRAKLVSPVMSAAKEEHEEHEEKVQCGPPSLQRICLGVCIGSWRRPELRGSPIADEPDIAAALAPFEPRGCAP